MADDQGFDYGQKEGGSLGRRVTEYDFTKRWSGDVGASAARRASA